MKSSRTPPSRWRGVAAAAASAAAATTVAQQFERRCIGYFRSWRLNILSMRSVIMKPPTTLIVAAVTATKPRNVLKPLNSAPAATSEPTSEMPEMALVADISGVCSRAGTLVMIWIADEAGQHEHVEPQERQADRRRSSLPPPPGGSRMPMPVMKAVSRGAREEAVLRKMLPLARRLRKGGVACAARVVGSRHRAVNAPCGHAGQLLQVLVEEREHRRLGSLGVGAFEAVAGAFEFDELHFDLGRLQPIVNPDRLARRPRRDLRAVQQQRRGRVSGVTQYNGLARMCAPLRVARSPPRNSGSTSAASTLLSYDLVKSLGAVVVRPRR